LGKKEGERKKKKRQKVFPQIEGKYKGNFLFFRTINKKRDPSIRS
jgi:hypothetical protein